MGLDFGEKRLGVAISDEGRRLAKPLRYLERGGDTDVVSELGEIIAEMDVEEVVIGLPVKLNGAEGEMAEASRVFGDDLEAELGLKVVFWDERLSTVIAEKRLGRSMRRQRRNKGRVDAAAAAVVLQDYLDSKRKSTPVMQNDERDSS